MPPITGSDAKHYWIRYQSDQLDADDNPIMYRVQLSLRHINWLKALGLVNGDLEPTPLTEEYRVGSGTVELKPRTIALTNGVKRRTVVFPLPDNILWTKSIQDAVLVGTDYTLEGESGVFHICGRRGERESHGVQDYAGE